MATTEWKTEWGNPDDPKLEWSVTPAPAPDIVDQLGQAAIGIGGRSVKEAHADRGVVMEQPVSEDNPHSMKIRKQVPRCECRRRAQIMVPLRPDDRPAPGTPPRENGDPLKVCVVDDAVHLWPDAARWVRAVN